MRIGWKTDDPPKDEVEDYLVTYKTGGMDILRWTNESRFGSGTVDWYWQINPWLDIAAWMELPEEYKAPTIDN